MKFAEKIYVYKVIFRIHHFCWRATRIFSFLN